ncbi:MAG: SecY family transport protein, partial [Candidatus Saccharimonadales bacterium]
MTRMLTFPLAILQSIGAIYLVRQSAQQIGGIGDITANTSIMQWVLMVAALTGGSMLLMWLGEQITEQSVGNGISLLITVGIVSSLPVAVATVWNTVFDGSHWAVLGQWIPVNKSGLLYALGLILAILIVTWIVVMLNEAARRITVNYAKRVQGNRTYGGVTTMLPIKLITAGVVPIIFAVAFLSVPPFVGQLLAGSSSAGTAELGQKLVAWFQAPTAQSFAVGGWEPFLYPVAYFVLVFLFTFFYTSITFNSKEIAENLQKQGGFIEGVRSGHQTEKYLSKTVNRLTLFGATSLGLLAMSPIIAQAFVTSSIALEGTSILILVAVSLETLRAVESRALMVTYDQYSDPEFFSNDSLTGSAGVDGGATKLKMLSRFKRKPRT